MPFFSGHNLQQTQHAGYFKCNGSGSTGGRPTPYGRPADSPSPFYAQHGCGGAGSNGAPFAPPAAAGVAGDSFETYSTAFQR